MRFFPAAIERIGALGGYVLLSYRWPGDPPEPGQFVMARPAGWGLHMDPFLARPFSVYDYEDGMASLLFEVRGRGTALLARSSDGMEVSAPLGRGFSVRGKGPVALLGGGVGMAPLRLLSRRLREEGVEHAVFLGFADAVSAGAARGFPGAVVATMDGSAGVRGTVLDAAGDLRRYRAVYACGPNPMLAAVGRAAGPGAQLSVEERMGCGNGSCNGCVVPTRRGYLRSCVEGPVFEAGVLAW
ncbi:dihydroorotate dehydrogenase B (NAD(+)), electron transfer subunit [Rubrobacter xylanophilus]|uniref:Dihydroorotate dehydrogenase B (NAD(+)), electron transfer subunit n=1 Tax=Rubrobacter xylanophilus TaxID=49319 RepID=A0A510HG61_9ACTN|nr:NAD-dependent dihydroorotate dehydrogenase B electron transfer subunit [Rubrobacter xylanophilus]BBL78934.1 dihydroorotate dehydrogenase B (NAD(+)), electron transfer subunit [Rubrobacter xylanophilus]